MKEVFTESVVLILSALVVFLFGTACLFYEVHQSKLMRYHCVTAAIQHGYTASEVQVICTKPTN